MARQYISIISLNNYPYGGASANYVRNLSFALSDEVVEVLLPTGNLYGKNVEKPSKREGAINNVRYKHLSFINHPQKTIYKFIEYIIGLFNLVFIILKKKLRKEIDIIIKYDVSILYDFVILICARICNIKMVFVLVEYYDKPINSFLLDLKWYDFKLGLLNAKFSDKVIVLSSFLENYLKLRHNYRKPILVQPNLIDCKAFKNPKIEYINNSINIIGYSGVLAEKDGIIDLLDSFKLVNSTIPNTKLLVIGDITNGQSIIPDLKRYASNQGIIDNIIFTGLVPSEKIPGWLASCDILVLPRRAGIFAEAGFPTKLGEYFASKKPVVVTKVGDIPKYLKHQIDVYFAEPGDILSISSGIKYFLENKNEANIIAENAYNWMRANLDFIKVSEKITTFLKDNA